MTRSIQQYGIGFLAISATVLMLANSGRGQEIKLVSPSRFADVESQIDLPPIPGPGPEGASRVQILYEASDFSSLAGPHWITQFAWRPDGRETESVIATSDSVVFRMSTTERTVSNMSLTFDENVGADEQVVAQSNEPQVTTVPVLGPTGGPKEFTIIAELENPFLYVPSRGNLLLDFILAAGPGSALAADNVAAPDPSLTTKWIAGPAAGSTAVVEFGGIITEFTFVPVPEPGSGLLLCIGVAAAVAAIYRRKAARRVR